MAFFVCMDDNTYFFLRIDIFLSKIKISGKTLEAYIQRRQLFLGSTTQRQGLLKVLLRSGQEADLWKLLLLHLWQVRAAAVISLAAFLQPVDPYGDDQDAVRLNTNVDVAQQLLMVRPERGDWGRETRGGVGPADTPLGPPAHCMQRDLRSAEMWSPAKDSSFSQKLPQN